MDARDVLRLTAPLEPTLRRLGVTSLALFGSVARGQAGAGSDIDLLVELAEPVTFDRFMDVRFALEDALGRRVDLVLARTMRPEVRAEVEKDLVRVA